MGKPGHPGGLITRRPEIGLKPERWFKRCRGNPTPENPPLATSFLLKSVWTTIAEPGFAGSSQKVIRLDELERYIGDGWEFVTNLNGDKAIVRLPSR